MCLRDGFGRLSDGFRVSAMVILSILTRSMQMTCLSDGFRVSAMILGAERWILCLSDGLTAPGDGFRVSAMVFVSQR